VAFVERVQSLLTDVGGHLHPLVAELGARVRAILLSPKATWPVIAAEPATGADLFLRYVSPLSVIPPLAKFLGWSVLSSHMGIGEGLVAAVVSYALSLAGFIVLAVVAGKLALAFEGKDSLVQGVKLVAYAATPSWVGGVCRLVPALGIVSLLASLYGCYLLYAGAAPVMCVPEERETAYTLILVAAAILLFVICNAILAAVVGINALGMI
jgi:hypothetical protein